MVLSIPNRQLHPLRFNHQEVTILLRDCLWPISEQAKAMHKVGAFTQNHNKWPVKQDCLMVSHSTLFVLILDLTPTSHLAFERL